MVRSRIVRCASIFRLSVKPRIVADRAGPVNRYPSRYHVSVDWEQLHRAAAGLGYALDDAAMERLARFHALLEAENQSLALTRLAGLEDYLERHVLDALTVALALPAEEPAPSRLADVGSGPGIPAIPLAVALPLHQRYAAAAAPAAPAAPPVHLAAIEAHGKKAAFIRRAADALALGSAFEVVQARAEDVGRDPEHRGRYDVVVARAVADLRVLAELCLPLCRPGGLFVAFKGPRADEEARQAAPALDALHGRVEAIIPAPLPGRELRLVRVRQLAPMPERFPRRPGVPNKRPL